MSMAHFLGSGSVDRALEEMVEGLLRSCGDDRPRSLEQEIKVSEAILDGANRLVSRARRRHNTLQRISQLPVDVAHDILKKSLGQRGRYYRDLAPLRRTCKQWQESIDCEPSFWCSLSNSEPLTMWNAILQRNPTSPLCMSYIYPIYAANLDVSAERPQTADFLEVAIREASRVRSFHLMQGGGSRRESAIVELMAVYLSLPAPLLEEIIIDEHLIKVQPDSLFGGVAPRLNVASFARPSKFIWMSSSLRKLQVLDINGGIDLNIGDLVAKVLPSSPSLVHLSIRDEKPPSSPLDATEGRKIALNSLKTLRLHNLSPDSLSYVLGSISIPSVDWIVALGFPIRDLHEDSYRHLTRHIVESTAHLSRPLRIRIWENSLTIGSKHFLLKSLRDLSRSSDISHTLLRLASEAAFESVPVLLSVEKLEYGKITEYSNAAAHAFPNVLQLSVSAHLSPEWVEALGPTNTSFPKLSRIVIHGSSPTPPVLRRALEIVKQRRETNGSLAQLVHITPDINRYTVGFQAIYHDFEGVVDIVEDAPEIWPEGAALRDYLDLAAKNGPLYCPVQDTAWTDTGSDDIFPKYTNPVCLQ